MKRIYCKGWLLKQEEPESDLSDSVISAKNLKSALDQPSCFVWVSKVLSDKHYIRKTFHLMRTEFQLMRKSKSAVIRPDSLH